MKASRLCWVSLAAIVCAAAGPQEKVELNTISKVEVRGNSIEIVGDRKPNFTTFSMSDPPRLVVDFSEAVFAGVSEELRGNGGLVAGIRTASYGSDASAIARVVIGFNRNVDTDIAIASGTKLVIKALGESSPPVAEASLGSAREGPKVSPVPIPESAAPVAAASKSKSAQAAPEAVQLESKLARLETERTAREAELEKAKAAKAAAEKEKLTAAAAEKEKLAAAEREKLAAAEREKPAAAEREKLAAAEKEKRAAAEKERLTAAEREKLAAAEQAKNQEKEKAEALKAAMEAKAQAANEAKRAAELQRAERAKALEDALAAKQAAKEAKAQAANEARRAKAKAVQDAIAAKRVAAADRKRRAEELREAKRHARVEAIAARAPSDPGPAQGDSGNAGPRRTVTFVGFQRESNGSRVFVRTTGPVRYSVSEAKDKTVVLELDNARVASRNTGRSLDTSHFDSVVAMVSTNQVPSHRVLLEIRLKDATSYQAKQDGNEVSLEFKNPTPR